ncbi:MAG: hypothetical protein ACXU86_00430 [Archangium sp.]
MDVQHARPEFPLLSAFGMNGDVEDGLTDSRRLVLPAALFITRGEPGPEGWQPEPEPGPLVGIAPPGSASAVLRRAEGWFERVGRWVSPRIANEELGDALECLRQVAAAGAPAWVLYRMAGRAVSWAALHAVQDATRQLAGELKKLLSR